MKKRLLVLAVVAALLSGGLYGVLGNVPTAQAARGTSRTTFRSSGPDADAFFFSTEGTISNTVTVDATAGSTQESTGMRIRGPRVSVYVSQFSNVEPFTDLFAEGDAAAPGLQIDGAHLDTASLSLTPVTVRMWNPVSGQYDGPSFTVELALSWTGEGPVTRGLTVSHSRSTEFSNTYHSTGTTRMATAVANTLTYQFPGTAPTTWNGTAAQYTFLSNGHIMVTNITTTPQP